MIKILLILFVNLIQGFICDYETKEPLGGVMVVSDVDTVYSDFDGKYNILSNKNDTNLIFKFVSYQHEIVQKLDNDTVFLKNY